MNIPKVKATLMPVSICDGLYEVWIMRTGKIKKGARIYLSTIW